MNERLDELRAIHESIVQLQAEHERLADIPGEIAALRRRALELGEQVERIEAAE